MNAELERLVRDEAEATRESDRPLGPGKRINRDRSTDPDDADAPQALAP